MLVLEKRHTTVDPRPQVMCGIARTIGETLDWRRTPTPEKNDLAEISAAFVHRDNGDSALAEALPVVKLVEPDDFSKDDRWDVVRFWSDDELVELGETMPPVSRTEFLDDTRGTLESLIADLEQTKSELDELTSGDTSVVSMSDEERFSVGSGTRITTRQIQEHPPTDETDSVTVYSCFMNPYITKGSVSRAWLNSQTIQRRGEKQPTAKYVLQEASCVTVNANGASVGKVFVRPAGCLLTDDVIAVTPVSREDFDLDFLSIALQNAVTAGGFLYEAKLFATRVRELEISIPVHADGSFDIEQQRQIASATKRFDAIVERLAELGKWSQEARFV